MTRSTRPPADRQFARDVARHIDRRRVRRRLTLWTALLALVAAAAVYLRCGNGLGLGGLGGLGGDDDDTASRPVAGPQRCAIRLSINDITVGGRAMSRDQAVAACKAASGVDIFPTDDAREGDLKELIAALEAAGARDIVKHKAGKPAGPSGEPPRGDRSHR